MARKYGLGILGLGVQGRSMAAAFARSERFEIVAAYDPVAPVSADVPRVDTADALTAGPDVDCVYIASPPAEHRSGVMLSIASRKGILCEKPLAPTEEIAADMAAAVAASGVPAAVNFGFTTDAVSRSVAAAVRRETLGPPVRASLEVRFPRWPRDWQAGAGPWLATPGEGGFTREVISHFAYLADRLLGPGVVTRSRVERRNDGLEERLDATVTYGAVPFEIEGSIGEGTYDVYRFVLECRDGTISIDDWENLTGIPITEPDEPTTAAFAALLDGEPRDLADFAAGARVVEVIEGLLR